MNEAEFVEQHLSRWSPPGPTRELREQVLARVAEELSLPPASSRRWGRLAAACVVASALFNWSTVTLLEVRLARYTDTQLNAPVEIAERDRPVTDRHVETLPDSMWLVSRVDDSPRTTFPQYMAVLAEQTRAATLRNSP